MKREVSEKETATMGILDGQVAIVTGAGRGFGQAIAQGLAAEGCAVGVTARTASQLNETVSMIESAGGKALAIPADVTNQADADRVVAETEAAFGPLTLLVNNAALSDPVGPIWEIDPDVWARTIDVNLIGQVRCAHAAMKGMVERGSGRVINVSSGAGLFGGPYDTAYRVSKTGIMRLTECIAAEAAPYGVFVFSIHPGVLSTTLHHSATMTPEGRKYLPQFGEMAARGASDPALAAECCVYLASGAADELTGRYFSATADYKALAARASEVKEKGQQVLRLVVEPQA
jgi:NAD(P)-dependent dehydrogenase (short-subunit alcohol dehydrogenase family)